MAGILAIWNDREAAMADLFEHWYLQEHIPERLGVPGFLAAHRYEAVQATPQFFTYYDTASPDVLNSEVYLARLASPTPRTREVMAGFRNMIRAVCSLEGRSEPFASGGCVVTARIEGEPHEDALFETTRVCQRNPAVLGVQLWRAAVDAARAGTAESRLRPGGDRAIGTALIVEIMREAEAISLAATVGGLLGGDAKIGVYRVLGHWRV